MQTTLSSPSTGLFQVHVGGLLDVVSRHLYSQGPEVFIRELLQNAVDAITLRAHDSSAAPGQIGIEVVEEEIGRITVTVEDNGIGLTWEEAISCLATIGYSSKRSDPARAAGTIGQFGIGLLSGFMVADEIQVISRSRRDGAASFLWKGTVAGTWEQEWLGNEVEPGTRVYLRLRAADSARFGAAEIARLARRFGRFLAVPVEFRTSGRTESITESRAPWDAAGTAREEKLLEVGERLTGIRFAGAFSFEEPTTESMGIAFLEPERVSPGADPGHWLYIRRMLVGEKVRDLVPPHLPFLRLVVNSNGLRVNAAREGLHGEETRLEGIHVAVSEALDAYLSDLARSHPERARSFVYTQGELLLRAVEENGQFLDLLRRFFPLESTTGDLTIDEALQRYRRIEYATRDDDFLKLEPRAKQEGVCILRGSYRQAGQMIHAMERVLPPGTIRSVTPGEFLARFSAPSDATTDREQRLVSLITEELKPENCGGGFYEGEDPFEPAILRLDDRESIQRHLGGSIGSKIWGGGDSPGQKSLQLNRNHRVIERWIRGDHGFSREMEIRHWIRLCYHHALLAGREVPTAGEQRRFSRAFEALAAPGEPHSH